MFLNLCVTLHCKRTTSIHDKLSNKYFLPFRNISNYLLLRFRLYANIIVPEDGVVILQKY